MLAERIQFGQNPILQAPDDKSAGGKSPGKDKDEIGNLVIKRRLNESFRIGEGPDAAEVTILGIEDGDNGSVKVGIRAPRKVPVLRSELIKNPNKKAD